MYVRRCNKRSIELTHGISDYLDTSVETVRSSLTSTHLSSGLVELLDKAMVRLIRQHLVACVKGEFHSSRLPILLILAPPTRIYPNIFHLAHAEARVVT